MKDNLAELKHNGGKARIVYFGTPQIAVAPLQRLVAEGHDVALVITNADMRRGRGKKLDPTPVKKAALELGLAVSHDLKDCLTQGADFGVVVAFGHYIPRSVLAKLAMVNIHFSLLPRWRGAAPLEWAILAGDEKTGTALMQVSPKMDAGAVYATAELSLECQSIDEMREQLLELSCDLLADALNNGFADPIPQSGTPVHARKLQRDDFEIDWNQSATQAWRVTRLGRAHSYLNENRIGINAASVISNNIKNNTSSPPGTLWLIDGQPAVQCGQGLLALQELTPQGRRRMKAQDWVNGLGVARSDLIDGTSGLCFETQKTKND